MGGDASGGEGMGAGDGGTGGTNSSGTGALGGADPSASGGSDSLLPELGGDCDQPGVVSCADANERLILLCSSDREWAVSEMCEPEEACDPREDELTAATCQPVLGVCESREDDTLFCDERTATVCTARGTVATVEDCPLGCEGGECGIFDDACGDPETDVDCTGECSEPAEAACSDECWSVVTVGSGTYTMRVPAATDACKGEGQCQGAYWLGFADLPESGIPQYVKVTVAPDWGIGPYFASEEDETCGLEAPSCMVVYTGGLTGYFTLIAKSDESAARNVLIEVVEEGTECPAP